MPSREHEAVTIGPKWIARVESQTTCPERVGHRRGAERHPRMSAVSRLHHVHRQKANGVDAPLV